MIYSANAKNVAENIKINIYYRSHHQNCFLIKSDQSENTSQIKFPIGLLMTKFWGNKIDNLFFFEVS